MSLHNNPEYNTPEMIESMKSHGFKSESPSQLSDAFRLGWISSGRDELEDTHTDKADAWDVMAKKNEIISDLKAENERMREALIECREEIDGYIRQEYPLDHPLHERYRERDFSANPARIALEED